MQTLDIAEKLEKLGLDHRDAYEIAEKINGKSGLATKEDIYKLEQRMIKVETSVVWLIRLTVIILSLLLGTFITVIVSIV